MHDELNRLDRLLSQLSSVLEVPGEEGDPPPEWTWQRLERLDAGMGSDALGALLRRQGMPRPAVEEALGVLAQRRAAQR
jgi:hypothetical protein